MAVSRPLTIRLHRGQGFSAAQELASATGLPLRLYQPPVQPVRLSTAGPRSAQAAIPRRPATDLLLLQPAAEPARALENAAGLQDLLRRGAPRRVVTPSYPKQWSGETSFDSTNPACQNCADGNPEKGDFP